MNVTKFEKLHIFMAFFRALGPDRLTTDTFSNRIFSFQEKKIPYLLWSTAISSDCIKKGSSNHNIHTLLLAKMETLWLSNLLFFYCLLYLFEFLWQSIYFFWYQCFISRKSMEWKFLKELLQNFQILLVLCQFYTSFLQNGITFFILDFTITCSKLNSNFS